MQHKTFDNNLVVTHKSKLELKLNKPAYTGMCMLELRKVLMYIFHYDYIKNKYDNKSKLLLTDTDSQMYEIRTEGDYEHFSSDKKILISVSIQLSQNTMIIQTNQALDK